MSKIVSKLRRLILVEGKEIKHPIRGVEYTGARAFWEINPNGFTHAVEHGLVCVDFDARTTKGANTTLRDHGTKFRIHKEDLSILYLNTIKLV